MVAIPYVKINGERYELDSDPDVKPYQEVPQELWQAPSQVGFWQSWVMRSWHGGERVTRILKAEDIDTYTYHDGEGVDVSTWGQVKIQPSCTRSLTISSATLPLCTTNDGSAVLCGSAVLSTYYMRRFSGNPGSWATISTPNAATVTDIITGKGQDMYAIQGSEIIESTNNGTSWANTAKTGHPTDMVGLAFCANQLFALGPTYLKYWDGAAWVDAATWGGTVCCTYGEEVYWANDARIFRYNGTSAYEVDQMPAGFTVTGLFPYRNLLLITGYYLVQGGKKGSVYYMLDGRDAHLFNIGSYDGSANYTVSACAGGDDEIYFANQKRGGADRYDLTRGGLSCGPAWGAAGVIPFKSMATHNGKLFIGRYDNVAGTDGVYIANTSIPTAYRSSGWFTTPEMDFLFPTSKKLFNVIWISCRALAASQRIKLEYSLNGGTTYTVAGYVEGTGVDGKEFRITNAAGSTVKLRITLEGPGTSTPTLTMVRVDGQPMGDPMYYWVLALALYSNRGGRNAILNLRKAYKNRAVLTFTDIYGEDHSAIIDQQATAIPIGDKWTAKIQLRLREV